jgi:predicted RNA-binding Zn ribbon-like protein
MHDRWQWLGGRPALDLVNTMRKRPEPQIETLAAPRDLSLWLVAAGLLDEPLTVRRSVLAGARELREAIDAAVRAAIAGEEVSREAVTAIDDWLVFAGARPALFLEDGVPRLGERAPADSPRRALGMVALDAARMVGLPEERARLRICAAETCGTRFYDRSPGGGRRWCSMRTCGNVAKARRYRARAT